jgi:toxin-antitoxin system PIN domain toxin
VNLVDANVLIYAVNSDAPHHERSKRWLEAALSGTAPVGMTWGVLLAFLRVTTRRGLLERPLPFDEALAYVDSWLNQPPVELVVPGPNHWTILRTLIIAAGTAGNLTSDAHLAAQALEGGWTLVSTDNDFRRFSGLNLLNPASDGSPAGL